MTKKRLGGWLLFFYITLFISLISLIFIMVGEISVVTEYPIFAISLIASITSFIIIFKLAYQIYKREKRVMKTLNWYFIILVISVVIDIIIGAIYEDYSGIYSILGVVIYVAIWRHYFSTAPRIKETFGVLYATYTCYYCGKKFETAKECDNHERICGKREKKKRIIF